VQFAFCDRKLAIFEMNWVFTWFWGTRWLLQRLCFGYVYVLF